MHNNSYNVLWGLVLSLMTIFTAYLMHTNMFICTLLITLFQCLLLVILST